MRQSFVGVEKNAKLKLLKNDRRSPVHNLLNYVAEMIAVNQYTKTNQYVISRKNKFVQIEIEEMYYTKESSSLQILHFYRNWISKFQK